LLIRRSRSCFTVDLVLDAGGEPLNVGDCFPLDVPESDLSRRTISALDDPPEGTLTLILTLAASAISKLLMIIVESRHNLLYAYVFCLIEILQKERSNQFMETQYQHLKKEIFVVSLMIT
jgi:hypothetical protein